MKYFILLVIFLMGCSQYRPLAKGDIQTVYVLFKDYTKRNYEGYKIFDGTVVKWDRKNENVKISLDNYKNKMQLLAKEDSNYLDNFLLNKARIIRYTPIKTLPLYEFGIIKTKNKGYVYYGIGDLFIDISEDKVYILNR